MSRRRGKGLSPSLFPFLAVLVCTLGTLILLLALVAQTATEAAENDARAEQLAQAEQQASQAEPDRPQISAEAIQSMLAEEKFRVEQLVAFREQQTADLEDRRDLLTHVEDHMSRLREQLKQISDEVERTLGESKPQAIEEETIAELRARIESEQKAVDQLRERSDSGTPRVVIVPHKGPNGTERRPVYLECTAGGVTIWPEGSQIPIVQLENAGYSANPLDAALRTIRLHAMQHYGDSVPPYPLLIVRPDGIESYAAARQAMRDWDDQFGYELVPANVELAFNKPDSQLKRRIELAIREAAAHQRTRQSIASLGGSGGRATRGTFDSPRGRGRLPILSAASLDRAGRDSGYRSLRDNRPPVSGSPYVNRAPQAGGSSITTQSPYSGGGPYTGGTQTYEADQAASEARKWANEMRSAAEEMRESRVGDSPQAGAFSNTDPAARSNPYTQSNPDAYSNFDPQSNGPAGTSGSGSENTNFNQNDPTRTAADGGSGSSTNRSFTSADPNAAPLRDGSESGTASSTAQSASASTGTTAGQARSNNGGSAGGAAASGTPMASGGQQMQSAGTPPQNMSPQAAPPPISLGQKPPSELVRRQGRNWALPEHMAGASGNEIVRTIRAECYADRFVLLPSGRGGATEVFGLSNGDVDRASLRFATAIRDRIDRWGPALPGGRWQPRLEIIIRRDGEMRFHQLRTLMSGSGVEVVGRASR